MIDQDNFSSSCFNVQLYSLAMMMTMMDYSRLALSK